MFQRGGELVILSEFIAAVTMEVCLECSACNKCPMLAYLRITSMLRAHASPVR